MNKVVLIGNLTRDPELSETNSGTPVCRFGLAVNRRRSNAGEEPQVDFFNVTAWRGLADTIARFTKKGHKVAVVGSIQMRTYEGNDGVKRTAVDVIAQDIEFLTAKNSSSSDDGFYDAPQTQSAPAKKKPTLQSFDDDGDIPF